MRAAHLDTARAVGRDLDGVPLAAQPRRDRRGDRPLVFDDEDRPAGVGGAGRGGGRHGPRLKSRQPLGPFGLWRNRADGVFRLVVVAAPRAAVVVLALVAAPRAAVVIVAVVAAPRAAVVIVARRRRSRDRCCLRRRCRRRQWCSASNLGVESGVEFGVESGVLSGVESSVDVGVLSGVESSVDVGVLSGAESTVTGERSPTSTSSSWFRMPRFAATAAEPAINVRPMAPAAVMKARRCMRPP